MKIHADPRERALVRSRELPWVASPMAGVERRMLERDGDEVARATSIVRYAPGSRFPSHRHDMGEEFLVLDGVFSDESGDFPVGAYVRNPPGTSHAPHSDPGCTILVKLRQFDARDLTPVHIETRVAAWGPADAAGARVMPLHGFGNERVRLVRLAPGAHWSASDGVETLVLEGAARSGELTLSVGDWLRAPVGERVNFEAGAQADENALLWVKTGHLPDGISG